MATFTVSTGAPGNFAQRQIFQPGATRTATSPNSLTYTNPDGTKLVFAGTDMAFDALDNPTAGTVHSITLFDASQTTQYAAYTDLAISLPSITIATAEAALLAGADTLLGNDADNRLEGLAGNDTIHGGAGTDRISYAHDADHGGTAGVTVDLSAGTATDGFGDHDTFTGIEAVEGTAQADTLTGGDGGLVREAYAAYGLAGDDTISAGLWDLYVEPGAGNDTLIAGTSYDQISYSEYTGENGATFNLATGIIDDPYGDTDTLVGTFEAAYGTNNDDTFIGNTANNVLRGLGGADRFDGGAGIDAVWYDRDAQNGGTEGVVVDLQAGIASDGFGAIDTLTSIENLRGTHSASADLPGLSDMLLGDEAANTFQGLAGTDYIDGRGGRDRIDYAVDDEYGATRGVFVYLGVAPDLGFALDGFGDTDILLSIEDIRGTNQQLGFGLPFSDVLIGSDADNNFQSLGGLDYIDGGQGSDTADYSRDHAEGGSSGIYVNLEAGYAIDGFGSGDALISIENVIGTDRPHLLLEGYSDLLIGSASDNTLDGRGGRDILDGGDGHDTLIGGAGIDIMTGGLGADIFVIDAASLVGGEYDLITDFVPGTDTIRATLAMQNNIVVTGEPGAVTLLYDTGAGIYALAAQTSATAAEVQAAIVYV